MKCRWLIERLKERGHELRRPQADYLRDGIYELRTRQGNVRYRMLYFFHCHVATVISHGITKKTAKVPPIEIKRAIDRKRKFEQNPQQHTQEMTERKPITDAVEILQRLYFEKDSEMMDWL